MLSYLTDNTIGYASLSTFREKPAYQQTAEVSIYIHKDHYRKGLGRLLTTELIERSRQLGYHVLIAGITGGKEASTKLFLQLGFEPVGTFREVGFKFNQYRDVTFYQLIL